MSLSRRRIISSLSVNVGIIAQFLQLIVEAVDLPLSEPVSLVG